MTKLKTLKDLEEYLNSRDEEIIITLKQEAIKWVKFHNKGDVPYDIVLRDVFMKFFNLSKKDLEDK